jgi:hypothetical protein
VVPKKFAPKMFNGLAKIEGTALNPEAHVQTWNEK